MLSDAYMLRIAADSLTDAHRDPQLALSFAQRAITREKQASAPEFITLARALRAAGRKAESRAAARGALDLLAAHPRSLGNAAQTAQAKQLADSAT